jgi:hypothetical protein
MGLRQETSSLKQIRQGRAGLHKIGSGQRGTGNQQQIGPGEGFSQKSIHCRPQQALGPIAIDCIPDRQTGADPHPNTQLVRFQDIQYNKRVGIRFAGTPHPLEIG